MKYANHIAYTDVHPFEVLRIVNSTTLEIRSMSAVEQPWERKFLAGGFLGHMENQKDQVWDIQPDKDGDVLRIRQHKDDKWYDRDGARYSLANQPRRFHDYNF